MEFVEFEHLCSVVLVVVVFTVGDCGGDIAVTLFEVVFIAQLFLLAVVVDSKMAVFKIFPFAV